MQLDRHYAIPKVRSSAVTTTRIEEMLWSMWHEHMRWLGRTKEERTAKEVEPDDHSEATRGHELYPHELASVNSTKLVP